VVNAAKDRIGPKEALALARKQARVVVAKGKKTLEFQMKDRPSDDELASAIIGPSGWLRAPAWKRGRTLVVGFNEGAYDEVLG